MATAHPKASRNRPVVSTALPTTPLGDVCHESMLRHNERQKQIAHDLRFQRAMRSAAAAAPKADGSSEGSARAAAPPSTPAASTPCGDDGDLVWSAMEVSAFVFGVRDEKHRKIIYRLRDRYLKTGSGMPFVDLGDDVSTVCLSKRAYWAWIASKRRRG